MLYAALGILVLIIILLLIGLFMYHEKINELQLVVIQLREVIRVRDSIHAFIKEEDDEKTSKPTNLKYRYLKHRLNPKKEFRWYSDWEL